MKEIQASHQQQFWSVTPMVTVGNTITPLVPPQPQGGNTHLETPPINRLGNITGTTPHPPDLRWETNT